MITEGSNYREGKKVDCGQTDNVSGEMDRQDNNLGPTLFITKVCSVRIFHYKSM